LAIDHSALDILNEEKSEMVRRIATTVLLLAVACLVGAPTITTLLPDQTPHTATPTVTSISPNVGTTAGGTSVAITGTNFTGTTAVSFGGTAAASFTVNNATSITATSAAGTGTVDITVTNPSGTSATSSADQFFFIAPGFYVATNGSDSNAGTLAAPFATLGKCQTAMQGGSVKTCYIRAGTYNTLPKVILNSGFPTQAALKLSSADNGETWSYYPPDGYNNAILDGGNTTTSVCQNTNFLDIGFYIGGASNITVNGLLFQHLTFGGILVHGGGDHFGNWVPTGGNGEGTANAILIENIIGQFINNGRVLGGAEPACSTTSPFTGFPDPNQTNTDLDTGGVVYTWGSVTNMTVTHSVGMHLMGPCFDWNTVTAGDSFAGLTVTHNFCVDVCTRMVDCGAIHIYAAAAVNAPAPLTGGSVSYNYMRDCGGPLNGTITGDGRCIYVDDESSGLTLNGNVAAGHFRDAVVIAHGGHNNVWTGNIVDLGDGTNGTPDIGLYQNSTSCTSGASCMTGNVWQQNIVISNSSSTLGDYTFYSPDAPPTLQNDLDHPYGSGSITDSASVSSADPQLSCWTYNLASGSPAYNSPVSFPTQPSNWGTPGFWGPPGFTIPHIGTVPSSPHTC
jgi:IPT/TIG domain